MTTLENQINLELSKAGISTTGSYATIVENVLAAIDTVQTFGYSYWLNQTTMGKSIKEIVLKLA